jgi:hypothetical protein
VCGWRNSFCRSVNTVLPQRTTAFTLAAVKVCADEHCNRMFGSFLRFPFIIFVVHESTQWIITVMCNSYSTAKGLLPCIFVAGWIVCTLFLIDVSHSHSRKTAKRVSYGCFHKILLPKIDEQRFFFFSSSRSPMRRRVILVGQPRTTGAVCRYRFHITVLIQHNCRGPL